MKKKNLVDGDNISWSSGNAKKMFRFNHIFLGFRLEKLCFFFLVMTSPTISSDVVASTCERMNQAKSR